MVELSLNNIKKYKETNLVLENITFSVYDKEKVGIVGVNGCGKSTILKLIAGIEELNLYPGSTSLGYDEGFISIPKGVTTAYLDQMPNYPEGLMVIEVLKLAFEETYAIEGKLRELETKMQGLEGEALEIILKQYSTMQHLYEAKGGYEIEEKLSKVIKGLNFNKAFLNRAFDLLSGGEKTTVILGKILIEKPDILLLDEPTNHLDLEAIEWLEGYLKSYEGIVIIVSHDRYFLDNVVTKIIEVEDKICETYVGNYSAYVKEKEIRMQLQFENFKEQQKQIKEIEKAIKDLRDWAQRADNNKFFKRAESMQKRLEKMDRINKPQLDKTNMKLDFKVKDRSGDDTVKAKGLYKSFEGKNIFNDAELLIKYGERVALIGSNGSGKTTFLRMLLGEETIDGGIAQIGANAKLAYLPQNISFNNEEATILEAFRDDVLITEGKAREYLSKFIFFGSSVFKKVKHLSGGERIRLKLSMLLYQDINLLILDEPTNHLDIDSIETFEEALEDFKGTIFFISHDRYFINKIGERIVAIEDYKFKTYLGNYDYYKSKKDEVKLIAIEEVKVPKEKVKKVKPVDESKKRERELAKLETTINELEIEISEIEKTMEISELGYEELNKLYCEKESLSKELEVVMERWLKINEE